MEIKSKKNMRRNGGQGRTVSFSDKKIHVNLDVSILNTLNKYALSANQNIRMSDLVMVRNFVETLDLEDYEKEYERKKRIDYLKSILEARVTNKIKNINDVEAFVNHKHEIDIKQEINFNEVDSGTIDFVNATVINALKTSFLEDYFRETEALYQEFKSTPMKDRGIFVERTEELVKRINNEFRRTKMSNNIMTEFTLTNGLMKNYVSDIYDVVTAPGRYIYTGCQGVNSILGGGLEATRFYLFAGTAGVGKSMFFINLMKQLKKWNKGYKPKDPTKIPTVVYLTQENSIEETLERLFAMISSGGRMVDYSKKEVQNILENEGELLLTEENNVNIRVIWKPDRGIDTSDLYTIVEDMEDEGEECICLLQDHIKRIRSVENCPDQRIELGKVVNEMKVFAQFKQIPVCSLTHLNRGASQTIEAAAENNKKDITKLLGRSNVGESLLMIDNADFAYILNKEFDKDGKAWLSLLAIKKRCYTELDFIYQPFEENNETNLLEDMDGAPIFKTTLSDIINAQTDTANNCKANGMKVSAYNMFETPKDLNEDDGDGGLFSKRIKTPPDGTLGTRIPIKQKVLNFPISPQVSEVAEEIKPMPLIKFLG